VNKTQKKNSLIKSPWLWTLLALVLIVAFAAFVKLPVAAETEAVAVEPAQTTEIAEAQVKAPQPEVAEAPAENAEQTTSEENTTVADTPSSDNCIACHTDQEQLELLAEEPEEVHSEEAAGEG